MAKDPVCHMNVDEAKATIQAEHGGETYYFCAERCKERFLAEPERYLSPKA